MDPSRLPLKLESHPTGYQRVYGLSLASGRPDELNHQIPPVTDFSMAK